MERLCRRINDVILKTLIVALPHLFEGHDACRRQSEAGQHRAPLNLFDAALQASPWSRNAVPRPSLCFEILGFDVYLSKKLKPYILEVNRAPSFTCDSSLDTEIKHDVLTSALKLLHLKAGDRNRAQRRAKESALKRLVRDPSVAAATAPDVATLTTHAPGIPPSGYGRHAAAAAAAAGGCWPLGLFLFMVWSGVGKAPGRLLSTDMGTAATWYVCVWERRG